MKIKVDEKLAEVAVLGGAFFGGGGGGDLKLGLKHAKLAIELGEVDFKPLIPKLKFITNKKKWSGHLMGKAMREIPEEDYNLIEGLLN
ncbi:hypothetical protein TSIB_0560 [Thermococcus sibiricus MM 739]|uniref:Uncharacterized protein n=1 Tax=Thermococcus sibiricus (strain DSM 12597 / MM 739) TaxID=604354 RepID=C6A1Y0_THESM|nr:hypothetical protein TSIB_0560 [Thermococcus sibiricus MM 739]